MTMTKVVTKRNYQTKGHYINDSIDLLENMILTDEIVEKINKALGKKIKKSKLLTISRPKDELREIYYILRDAKKLEEKEVEVEVEEVEVEVEEVEVEEEVSEMAKFTEYFKGSVDYLKYKCNDKELLKEEPKVQIHSYYTNINDLKGISRRTLEVTLEVLKAEFKDLEDFRNKLVVAVNKQERAYRYTYKHRGFSIGCQPKDGFIQAIPNNPFEIIEYSRKLSSKEISEYELIERR